MHAREGQAPHAYSFGSRIFNDCGSLGVGPALKVVEPEVVLLEDVAGKQLIAGFLDSSETMLGKWDGRWAAGVSLCIEAGHPFISSLGASVGSTMRRGHASSGDRRPSRAGGELVNAAPMNSGSDSVNKVRNPQISRF